MLCAAGTAKLLNRPELIEAAEYTRQAVYVHYIIKQDGKPFFAWSEDLSGHYDIYDESLGNLQLLPFYDFCDEDSSDWQNTVSVIRDKDYPLSFAEHPIAEIGCKHAPHP